MKQKQSQTNNETRCVFFEEARARVTNEETRTIRGYGIVFDKDSVDLRAGGKTFVEVIRRSAVDGVDLSRLMSMHNHDPNRLIGTAHAGTMRTGVDDKGAWYEVDLPNSPTGDDVLESVRRGDTRGSSFQFRVSPDGERWTPRDNKAYREITKFAGVYEMGPVSEPAYPDTSISARSLESLESLELEPEKIDSDLFARDALDFDFLTNT